MRFCPSTIARPKGIGLRHEKVRERRAESRRGAHERGNASLSWSDASECGERFARAAPQREIREQPTSLRRPRDHRRASHESGESQLEREAGLQTNDHRIDEGREIRTWR